MKRTAGSPTRGTGEPKAGSAREREWRRGSFTHHRAGCFRLCRTLLSLAVVLGVSAPAEEAEPDTTSAGGAAVRPVYDTLAGDLPGVVLARKNPYLVVGDVFVPQGKVVQIQAGAVFLFKNFTGLHVLGRLEAAGTKEKPVVLTSENDRDYNPVEGPEAAPYDWNGIRIHADAVGTELKYCAVMYAVDGIISETRFIRIDPCVFVDNGNSNLTIEGKVHEVSDQYYRYSLSVDDPSLKGVPLDILRDPLARRRNILRYSGLAVCAGGCVMGILFSARYGEAQDELHYLSGTARDNLAANSSEDWERASAGVDKNLGAMLTGWGLMTAGAFGFAWTFTF